MLRKEQRKPLRGQQANAPPDSKARAPQIHAATRALFLIIEFIIENSSFYWFNQPAFCSYRLSRAAYMVTIGAMTAPISTPTMQASTMMIMGSMAAISDCTAISTSSS